MKRSSFSKLRWLLRTQVNLSLSEKQSESLKWASLGVVSWYLTLILPRLLLAMVIGPTMESYDTASDTDSWLVPWCQEWHGRRYDTWVIRSTPSKKSLLIEPTQEIVRFSFILWKGMWVRVPLNLLELTCDACTIFKVLSIPTLLAWVPLFLGEVTRDPSKDGGKKETFLDFTIKTYLDSGARRGPDGSTRSTAGLASTTWIWVILMAILSVTLTCLAGELSFKIYICQTAAIWLGDGELPGKNNPISTHQVYLMDVRDGYIYLLQVVVLINFALSLYTLLLTLKK